MNTTDPLTLVGEHFGRLLAGVGPDQWTLPTPCTEWTVADLVDHVVGANRWATLLLGGAAPGDALDQVRQSRFGHDRHAEYAASVDAQLTAFTAPGADERTVEHFIGPITGATFRRLRVADVSVHSWDLARAVGVDERLPDELVRAALDYFEPLADQLASRGWFGSGPDGAGPAATRQQRLLHLTGRRP